MARETLQQKRARYARELKNKQKDNDAELTAAQAGFRMGVLNEAQTQARIYKYNKALAEGKTKAEARKISNAGKRRVQKKNNG